MFFFSVLVFSFLYLSKTDFPSHANYQNIFLEWFIYVSNYSFSLPHNDE